MRGYIKKLSPFSWSKRTVKVMMTVFYMIAVPAFIFIGLQPAEPVDASALPLLDIPAIALSTPVSQSTVENRELSVPDRIAGVYSQDPSKLLLIGHSATVFKDLKDAALGDEITYDGHTYTIKNIEVKAKSAISMKDVLSPESEPTIILMTCSGEPLGNNDYTHRLIITAS